jgi:hypothetical protein
MPRANSSSVILRIALFSAAFAGFVFAMLLAGAPELHEWAHQDSGGAEHQCLATALHSGSCDHAAPAPSFTVIALAMIEATPEIRTHAAPSFFLSCRSLDHAPPARA